jgi:acyl-CoA synthetase (AMP-forming)/AMP-acid ligase II
MTAAGGFVSRLAHRSIAQPDAVAFRFLGRGRDASSNITWGELWRQGCDNARLLGDAGVEDGRIGIACARPRDFVLALVAVLIAGATAVPMPSTLGRRSLPRMQAIIGKAGLAAIFAPDMPADAEGFGVPIRRLSLEWQTEARAALKAAADMDPSSPLLIQFTSGSTGAPEGIELSHANVGANCASIARTYALDETSIGVSWLPLHHDMGLIGHVLVPLWQGGCSVLMDPLAFLQRPLSWLQAVSDQRATITSAPSFAYELCARASGAAGIDLRLDSLKTAICGGEPIDPRTLESFAAAFAANGFRREALAPSYGLAEATLLVSSGKSATGPSTVEIPADGTARCRYVKLGRPVHGMRVRLVNCGREVKGEREVGEIQISGPSVGRKMGAVSGEWTTTGDLGLFADDELVVVGRAKELLIVRGENVYPADVEAAALAADAAIIPGGVAAIGVAVEGTQAILVVAEIEPRARERLRLLCRKIREGVAGATGHVPEVVLVPRGSLPRTTSGKLQRSEIAARYESGHISGLAEKDTATRPAHV